MTVVGILHEDMLYISCHLECNLLIFIMVKDIRSGSFTKKMQHFMLNALFLFILWFSEKKLNKGE